MTWTTTDGVGHPFLHLAHASARSKLSVAAAKAIEDADRLLVSAITPWEIAIKAKKGKLELDRPIREWMRLALSHWKVELLPLDLEVSIRSVEVRELLNRDPADCIIVATALHYGLPIVTRDAAMARFPRIRVIW
ncbi:MAG: type II toxin-antitoxin system VapC family toxin [Dehalococcoidia bacterium]